jgi:2',3'-cyclic-nucleotide 2'-phosphodiesterase/3'-nucleotidase/5'-nucleotidase
MISLLIAASLIVTPAQDTAHVVLVATTDLHGHMTGRDYIDDRPAPVGVARVASVVDSLRTRYPGQVVLLDAGDLLQGDPFATYFARAVHREPHPIIEAMNLTGYDAVTPGSHDFDWGVPLLRRAIGDARFAYVSANIFALPGDTLLLPAYRVVQREGVRVGISGFTTPAVMAWDRAQVRGRMRVAPIESVADQTLGAVRRDADLSVVVIHSGMDGPSSYDDTAIGGENVAARLATLASPPDVVVVGHSHREMRDSVIGGVHFVQPAPFGASVSVVHVSLVRSGQERWRIRRIHADVVITRDVRPSDLLVQRLAAADDSVRAWVRTPLGQASGGMRSAAARAQPTPIITFVNEVQRRQAHADLSVTSAFDLRAGFDADTIRIGHVLALYPYENTLRAIRISGDQLKRYLEWSARYFLVDAGGRVSLNDSMPGFDFDVVSGVRYDIDLRRPVGDRIQNLALVGRPVAAADSFTLAINSYRQSGAGRYEMIRDAPVVYDRNESISELLMAAIRRTGIIDPRDYVESNWRIVPETYAVQVRNLFGIAPERLPESPKDSTLLRVLATADLRSNMLDGAGPAAATMDNLAAACACASIRLDTGDAMQGSPLAGETEGRAVVAVLKELRYDAAAIGDRDFDWGVDTLRQRMADASYPWLVANVFDSATGRRPDWVTPYRMVRAGGATVAVLGYVTPETKRLLPEDRTRGLRVGEGELALHDVLGEIAALKPTLTILLVHADFRCDSVVCDGEAANLAEQLGHGAVGLIIAGHSGRANMAKVGGIPIVQAGGGGSSIAVTDLVRTSAGGLEARSRLEPVDTAAVPKGPALAAALQFYRRRRDSLDARPIVELKRPLPRDGNQFALGGLLAEARRNAARADVGLIRNAVIAADLPAGAITYGRLTAVEPRSGDVVAMRLSGVQLRVALEHALDGGAPSAHIAGARVRYDPRKPPGRRIESIALSGKGKLKSSDRYVLATDDATASGAGGYEVLRGLPVQRTGLMAVEADAVFLRKLPQPVEVGAATGFVSTSR